jgi:hypothetical protein
LAFFWWEQGEQVADVFPGLFFGSFGCLAHKTFGAVPDTVRLLV